jgi:hypothetical protein
MRRQIDVNVNHCSRNRNKAHWRKVTNEVKAIFRIDRKAEKDSDNRLVWSTERRVHA